MNHTNKDFEAGNAKGESIHRDLSVLLNAIPSIVSYVDQQHVLRYVNSAFEAHFGIPGSSVTGRHITHFLGEEGYSVVKPYMEQALKGNSVHYETEVPFKTGKRIMEVNYSPDIDETGVVRGYISLVNDVTDKRKTE